ncbi:hypothetical protein ACHAWT_005058 [Skeletonema menzelii]
MPKSTSKPVSCDGCRKHYPSKNKLFQHLALNIDGCLSPDEYAEYLRNPRNFEKICVLYGYLPGTDYQRHCVPDGACGVESGQHASWLLTQAIDRVCQNKEGEEVDVSWSADKAAAFKINRSYGTLSRNTDAAHQDEYTGAITEMLCTNTSPLFFDFRDNDDSRNNEDDNATKEKRKKKVTLWVQAVNQEIDHLLSRFTQQTKMNDWSPGRICVFGRLSMPQKKFNPETDVVHRRVDYCFPADLLYVSTQNDDNITMSETAVQLQQVETMEHFFDKMVTFPPGNKPVRVFDASTVADRRKEDDYVEAPVAQDRDKFRPSIRPDEDTLTYLYSMKKVMQAFTTKVEDLDKNDSGAVLEKKFSESKRIKQKQHNSSKQGKTKQKEPQKKKHRKQEQDHHSQLKECDDDDKKEAKDSANLPAKRFLRRKRFHNFSPNVLAHDFLAYRRLDRFYHRGTIRLDSTTQDGSKSDEHTPSRPFVVFSLTGDLFLYQQARRVIGLLIAILRGCIDIDILNLVFDENYAHLVSAPLAPSVGLMQGEATYMTFEGRLSMVLSARRTHAFSKGFNDEDVVTSVEQWEASVLKDVAKSWYFDGTGANGHLNTGTNWLETVLNPWAATATIELENYRRWKAGELTASLPPVISIDTSVPNVYAKCLQLLREADANGAWPDTSAQRQLVMLSTPNDESQTKNLTAARMAAKTNNSESRSCAYSFKEGEGGASGSFSVGIMPDRSSQPKGNLQFPLLVKAAFELERALFPDREPSSTIAINRNAQFRPHKDKGAGAGQSTSLIVAMGNFVGGELVVEGTRKDIRYNPIQFNGWKQRHWTLPFKGERYSLVWFTPKGCEGMRGIDLDFDSLSKGK